MSRPPRALAMVAAALGASLVLATLTVPEYSSPRCATRWSGTPSSPIQHLFLIVQENHAFENYFGAFPGVAGYPPNGSFPSSFHGSGTVAPYALSGFNTSDFEHDRGSELVEWDGGKNDQFVAQANASGFPHPNETVGHYTAKQLAGYWSLAQQYGLGDHFFSGVLGPTAPNRIFDLTAFSGDGWYFDTPPPNDIADRPTILGQLSQAGVPWAYDYAGTAQDLAPTFFPAITHDGCSADRILPVSDLSAQLRPGPVPSVVYIDSSNSRIVSEHPPQNVSVGEAWAISLIDSILQSPVGSSSMILLFYDEAGGFWDPLPPPMTSTGLDGFRVPILAISPWTPAHTLCATTLDPAAVLHFVDENWGLPYLNDRVATAPGLGCFLDLTHPARTSLPLVTTGGAD
ncbi:MAG TPA: alkaline phosphatase family protein [Thermoplasmata archaeon]|nr:alkaline phosphatase family protein [Thermoplasmata archaeon]